LNEGVRDSHSNVPAVGVRRTGRVVAGIATIVAIDQLTKIWAVSNLADGPKRVIGDTVELSLTRNGGSAFSRFQGMTPVLAVGAIIVTIVLVRVLHGTTDRVLVIALSLVLGGALGNLTDRFLRAPGFLRGHVGHHRSAPAHRAITAGAPGRVAQWVSPSRYLPRSKVNASIGPLHS
jgi:lipoprotein signal peptidase